MKMKIPSYFLNTVCHLALHRGQQPMDINLILLRIGKALGFVQ